MRTLILFLVLVIVTTSCTTTPAPESATAKTAQIAEADPNAGEALAAQDVGKAIKQAEGEGVPLLVWDKGEVELRIANPVNGETVDGKVRLSLGESGSMPDAFAISPEHDKIAVATGSGMVCSAYAGGSRCITSSDTLHIVDVERWEVHSFPIPGETSGLGKGWVVGKPVFSPDGLRVTIAYATPEANTVLQYISDTGARFARRSLNFTPELVTYTHTGDSEGILVYGTPEGEAPGMSQPPPPRVELLDPITLQPLGIIFEGVLSGFWCLENCEGDHANMRFASWQPGAALSPDGKTFYLVHPGEAAVTIFDLVQMEVIEKPIRAGQSQNGRWAWLDKVLQLTAVTAHAKGMTEGELVFSTLSADGKVLYIARQAYEPEPDQLRTFVTLEAVDVKSGELLTQMGSSENTLYINGLRRTMDGESILLSGWDEKGARTEIYEGKSLELLGYLDDWEVIPGQTLDGENILLGIRQGDNSTELAFVEPGYFEIYQAWRVEGFATWVSE